MRYENQKNAHLMIWETNQAKRNINNVIKFNIHNTSDVEIGDEIFCKLGNCKESVYRITELLEVRESSMPNMNYVTAKTEWFIN